MDIIAGWLMFILLIIVNSVVYMLIDGYFENDIPGVLDNDEI